MGGSSTQRSEQTTTTSPPANQQTNIDQLLRGALDYYNSGGRTFFPGETVAGFDPLQTQGQNQILDYANGTGSQLIGDAFRSNAVFTNPDNILNPSQIPGFQGSVDAVTRGLTQNLTENILPSVRGGGTYSGQFGGTPQGIGEALSTARTQDTIGDVTSNMYLNAYGQGLNSFNQAMNRVPSLFALGGQPGQIASDIGTVRQGQTQREIDSDVRRHEFAQNEPIMLLNLLQALTGNAGQYGGTVETTGKSEGGSPSGANLGIGSALSLASLFGGGGGFGGKGGGDASTGGNPGGGGIPSFFGRS